MKKKSLTVNAVVNTVNTFLTIAFQLFTYPYAARVLQADNIGKVSFSSSIVSYFALIAALGYSTYAVREGSVFRENRKDIQDFSSVIFTLNAVTLVIAYLFLGISLCISNKLRNYSTLILIQSMSMITAWIGVSWINVIYEDYLFMTLRSIVIQIMSIAFMLIFVKGTEDYYIYTMILIGANCTVSILNFIHIRKYVKPKLVYKRDILRHLHPIFVFFSNTLVVSIYLNSDTTMIGLMLNDHYVGLYSLAVKIYTALKSIIASIYSVVISRMSNLIARGEYEEFEKLLNKVLSAIIFLSIPLTIGLYYCAYDVIILVSGESYAGSVNSLRILSFAFLFAILGGALAYCVYAPIKKEKIILIATVISAIENIILNIFFIPLLKIDGAALTTLFAEITVCFILLSGMKNKRVKLDFKGLGYHLLKVSICTLSFIPIKHIIFENISNIFLRLIVFVLSCILIYLLCNLILNRRYILKFIKK